MPQLPGHARGEAHHPRTRPAPVRDAQGRRHHRRLAVRGGPRRPRPLPGLQRLHQRLPGQRRHAHLQSRVPLPPLQIAPSPAPAPRLRVRLHRPDGQDRLPRSRTGQLRHAHAGVRPPGQAGRGHRPPPPAAAFRAHDAPGMVRPARWYRQPLRPSRRPVPGHLQQPLPHRCRRRLRRGDRSGRMAGRHARSTHLLRTASVRLRIPGRRGALPPPCTGCPASPPQGRHTGRRHGTELPGRLQGRVAQTLAA